MGLPWLDREERGAPQRHAEAFFIGDMPSAHASDSAFSVCAEGVERWLSGSFLWRSASTAGESQTTKNRREGRFLCCPVLPWKRLGSQDGASGETRTLTLSPETDFESAASTDSATEAMAAQYREAPTVGQSGSWRGKHISGKLRGLSRVSPCVSPIFISTCPRL